MNANSETIELRANKNLSNQLEVLKGFWPTVEITLHGAITIVEELQGKVIPQNLNFVLCC